MLGMGVSHVHTSWIGWCGRCRVNLAGLGVSGVVGHEAGAERWDEAHTCIRGKWLPALISFAGPALGWRSPYLLCPRTSSEWMARHSTPRLT